MNRTVSIIIPLFNREKLIVETLRSVKAQTHTDFECIVVDDGSTDNSFQVAKDFAKDDERFIVFRRQSPVKGACACRNEGLARASGKYLMFLDSDDLLAKDCLGKRFQRFNQNSSNDFIVNQVGLFGDENYMVTNLWSSLKHEDDLNAFLYSEGWQTSSTCFKTTFVKQYRYDENAMSWQDVDFHIRILLDKPTYTKFPLDPPDVYMRNSGAERISNTNLNFKRILSRLKLYMKLENHLEQKVHSTYRYPFLIYYFKFLEIAALILPYAEFQQLVLVWKASKTYSFKRAKVLHGYLVLQANLKRAGLRIICSAFYRMIRLFIPGRLLYSQRKMQLKPPIKIGTRD